MTKALIKDYMEKVWNQKKVDEIEHYFHPDVKIHSSLGEFNSSSEMKTIVSKWLRAVPDMEMVQLNLIEENGLVVSHWECKGTHQGELQGLKPEGKSLCYQGITLHRVKDGKIIEYWTYVDAWGLERQLE